MLSTLMSSIASLSSEIALMSVDADGADDGDDGFADDASAFSIVSIAGDVKADSAWMTPSPFVFAALFLLSFLPVAVDMICLMRFVVLLCRC